VFVQLGLALGPKSLKVIEPCALVTPSGSSAVLLSVALSLTVLPNVVADPAVVTIPGCFGAMTLDSFASRHFVVAGALFGSLP